MLYSGIAYSAYHIQKIRNKPKPPSEISSPEYQKSLDVNNNSVYSNIAGAYDSKIKWDEFFLRITARREELAEMAEVPFNLASLRLTGGREMYWSFQEALGETCHTISTQKT